VNNGLTQELVGKGFKRVRSRGTAQQVQMNCGGVDFGTEDKPTGRCTEYGGTTGKSDPKPPCPNVKARQARDIPIRREELHEAVALQLREVGIEIELVEADWVAAVRPKLQKREASGFLWAVPPSKKAVEPQIAVFNVGKGIGHIFQTDEIYKMWEDLLQITDG